MKLQHPKIGAIPSPPRGEGQDEGANKTMPYLIKPPPLPDGERELTGQQ